MKKLVVVSAFAFFCLTNGYSQIQKGNVMVGGDLANIQLSLNKGGNFNVRIDPKAAWFIRDNLAVGAYVDLGLSTAKGAGSTVNYGVGPLARYYLSDKTLSVLKQARFFVEGNFGIEGYNQSVGSSTNGFGIGIGPGMAYFVTPNIGLEALVKFNDIVGFGSAVSSSNINLGFGFQIYLPSSKIKSEAKKLK